MFTCILVMNNYCNSDFVVITGESGVEVETEGVVDTMQLSLEEIPQETQQIIEEEVETLTNTIQLLPEVPLGSQPEQEEQSLEDQLRSQERLDRSSPDLWPQNCKQELLQLFPFWGRL